MSHSHFSEASSLTESFLSVLCLLSIRYSLSPSRESDMSLSAGSSVVQTSHPVNLRQEVVFPQATSVGPREARSLSGAGFPLSRISLFPVIFSLNLVPIKFKRGPCEERLAASVITTSIGCCVGERRYIKALGGHQGL